MGIGSWRMNRDKDHKELVGTRDQNGWDAGGKGQRDSGFGDSCPWLLMDVCQLSERSVADLQQDQWGLEADVLLGEDVTHHLTHPCK